MFLLSLEFNVQEVSRHVSVLLDELVQALLPEKNKNYLDLTLGGAGHTEALLKLTAPEGVVLACDRDQDAIARGKVRLATYANRVRFSHVNYEEVGQIIDKNNDIKLHGAMIDAGLSSDQLDQAERGFSFMHDAPLDMRMNQTESMSVKDLIAQASEEDLANMIYVYGEERFSRRIAKCITEAKRQGKMNTTFDLSEAVMKAFNYRRGKIHPATKTFQALRIALNRELEQLQKAVETLLVRLPALSRIAVITFHSLEDRIVKNLFRDAHKNKRAKLINKKPIVASKDEMRANPRARSAKLRVVEMLEDVA